MNRSETDISNIQKWRQQHGLISESQTLTRALDLTQNEPKNFHFFNYDPSLGPTDLSNISFKNDENHDSAVFSIPLSFTDNSKSKFKYHEDTTRGLDIQAYLTPHNTPLYPLKK